MTDIRISNAAIRSGVWQAEVLAATETPPEIAVQHLEVPLEGVTIGPHPGVDGAWVLRAPIAPELLNEGVHTFLVVEQATGQRLDSFTILAGAALENDIRAEVDLLRAELDLLKRAFRRHCLETAREA